MSTTSLIISAIAIAIVLVIAWNEFGVKDDLDRLRGRLGRRRGG
jgi:hypothetical protein